MPDERDGHNTVDVSAIVGDTEDAAVPPVTRSPEDILNDPTSTRAERLAVLNAMAEDIQDEPDPEEIIEPVVVPELRSVVMRRERGKFVGAVWLLGASWAQLGGLFGVRRETVMQQANKYIPPNIRAEYAYNREGISYERVSELFRSWEDLCTNKQGVVNTCDCVVLANILNKHASKDDEGGGDYIRG